MAVRWDDGMVGASAPLGRDDGAALYGPAPWRFAGRSFTVIARCDPAAVAALVPAPLKPHGPPLVRFSVHWLICDLGFGWGFAQAHPQRCQMHEAVVGVAVEHDGRVGYWDPVLWCDGAAEVAVGREMYGWPQLQGDLAVTLPHPVRGFGVGDRVAGKAGRRLEPGFEIAMTIEREGDLAADIPAFVTFFTMRVLPDPATGGAVRELFGADMAGVAIGDLWSGSAEVRLHDPLIRDLAPAEVLGGRVHWVEWTKGAADRLDRRTAGPAR